MRRRTFLQSAVALGLAACGASPTPVPTTVPQPAPTFLRMLAYLPAPLDRWERTLSFANPGVIKQRYGMVDVRSYDDLTARGMTTVDYSNLLGCFLLSQFAYNGLSTDGEERRVFGFDFYQVDRDLCAGEPPMLLTTRIPTGQAAAFGRMEGMFDTAACGAALAAGGYRPMDHDGAAYYTALGDDEVDLRDVRWRIFPARRNRMAVGAARIIAAPTTALMAVALDAERRRIPTLDGDPTLRALARALGDPVSVATATPDYADRRIAYSRARSRNSLGEAGAIAQGIADRARGWGTLRAPELLAVAFSDTGAYRRTMHLAIVYADPADAAVDAPEIATRLAGYHPFAPFLATGPDAVTQRTTTSDGRGVIVADFTLAQRPDLNPAWYTSAAADLLFAIPLRDPMQTARRLMAEAMATRTPAPTRSAAPAP